MFGYGLYGDIYYTQDPSLGWTKMDLNPYMAYDISYGNGYWVLIFGSASSRGIYYSSTIEGAWENYSSSYSNFNVASLTFGDGYFVAVGGNGQSFYASDPTASSNWTKTTGVSTSNDFTEIGRASCRERV